VPGADPAAAAAAAAFAVEPIDAPVLVTGPEEDAAAVPVPIDEEYVPIRCVPLRLSYAPRLCGQLRRHLVLLLLLLLLWRLLYPQLPER
jgi:hypothetical protein